MALIHNYGVMKVSGMAVKKVISVDVMCLLSNNWSYVTPYFELGTMIFCDQLMKDVCALVASYRRSRSG